MTKKVIIVLFVAFTLFQSLALASTNKKSIEIFIDDKKVISDVSPFIYNNKTLVPLRVISENLGATVNYEINIKRIVLSYKNITILLKVNDPYAYIRGKKINLDVPPMIKNNRAFVPLRFIAENFEAKVFWDGENKIVKIYRKIEEIKEISWDDNEGVLKITGDNPLNFSIQGKENNIIVDLSAKAKQDQNFNIFNEKFLKDAQIIFTDNGTRIILEKKEGLLYEYFIEDGVLKVKFFSLINKLEYVKNSEGSTITIMSSGPVEYKYFTLGSAETNDYRLVVDFYYSRPAFEIPKVDGDIFLKSIRASQFSINPDITRLVFDMRGDFNYFIDKKDEGLLIEFKNNAKLLNVRTENQEGKSLIIFELDKITTYSVKEDALNKNIIIEINKTNLVYDKNSLNIVFFNGIPGNIFLKEDESKNIVSAFINTGDSKLLYDVNAVENKIVIEFSSLLLFGKTIVIDPGHGGSDPGAVYQGVYEKDLNLDIALRLKKILEDNGARVLMTRESDVYVNLYARAGMANEIKADIFISIHNNSSPNPATSGVQTLYFPTPEKKKLAELIQKSMVQSLNIPDLGIIERTGIVVIRETVMPSCLVEVAFMSNPKDLSLLLDENFRQKAAEGVFKGILNYFEKAS